MQSRQSAGSTTMAQSGRDTLRPEVVMKGVLALVAVLILQACGGPSPATPRLAGDWDYERTLGAAPNGGFEARRRFGFAHFDGPSAAGAWLKRRSGDPLETIASVALTGDSLVVS